MLLHQPKPDNLQNLTLMSKKINYHIYVDTNVLVDYYTGQEDAVACLKYLFSINRKENLFTSTLALVQTVSQLQKKNTQRKRKAVTKEKAIEYLDFLFTKFMVLDLVRKDILDCYSLTGSDIEDNVHYIVSQKLKCKRIITRNVKDYAQFPDLEALASGNIKLIKRKVV